MKYARLATDRLAQERIKAGLTIAKVGKIVGVSHQTVSRWERGVAAPSTDSLKRLAVLFNVSTDYLLGFSDTPTILKEGDDVTKAVLFELKDLKPEQLQDVLKYITFLKSK